jgi:hypothetical protein
MMLALVLVVLDSADNIDTADEDAAAAACY